MTVMAERPVLPPTDPGEQHELDEIAVLMAQTPAAVALIARDGTVVHLPPALFDVLTQVISAMRAGRAITIAPLAQRLTTQEAAELLGVSRPTLIKLLEEGEIPFEVPGRHRRIRLDDLLDYRERRRSKRKESLDELVRQTEDLGLYRDEPDIETR